MLKLPESGFCKTTNSEVINLVKKHRPKCDSKSDSFTPLTIGIAWNTYSHWFIKNNSNQEEYTEQSLLNIISIKSPKEFKAGDYIVALKSYPNGQFTTNYIYKQSRNNDYISCEKDNLGSHNGWRAIHFNIPSSFRYATTEEIAEYDRIGKPYDVTTLGSTKLKEYDLIQKALKDYPVGTKFYGFLYNGQVNRDLQRAIGMQNYFKYDKNNDIITTGYGLIYYKGKWAEIIGELKQEDKEGTMGVSKVLDNSRTSDYFSNTKIWIGRDLKLSALVQEKLFSYGISWARGIENRIQVLHSVNYISIVNTGARKAIIWYTSDKDSFNKLSYREITLSQLGIDYESHESVFTVDEKFDKAMNKKRIQDSLSNLSHQAPVILPTKKTKTRLISI